MRPTRQLHDLGQSLWLDNITRGMLDNGRLARHIAEDSITGVTSNPSILDAAFASGDSYDAAIRAMRRPGVRAAALVFALVLEDLRRAADLLRAVFDATAQRDGWVSMEISPLLANDGPGSLAAASYIHRQAARENLLVKIPGTAAGLAAIEQAIYLGIPVNVTLLFSPAHYVAAAQAYMTGIERRLAVGKPVRVASVASLFISRWDVAANADLPIDLRNRLGIAIAGLTYRAHRALLAAPRWQALAAAGAAPQRLLWASTGSKETTMSDTLYVSALAAPDTINTLPEKTLRAFADHGRVDEAMPADGGEADAILAEIALIGLDIDALAARLQHEGVESFATSWRRLLQRVADQP